jgi:hypothetical protein
MLERPNQQRKATLSRPDLTNPDGAQPPHGHRSIQTELQSLALPLPVTIVLMITYSSNCEAGIGYSRQKSSGDQSSYNQRQMQPNFPRITEPSTTA